MCVILRMYVCFTLCRRLAPLDSICHGEVRRARSGRTPLHYWLWFSVLEKHSCWDKFSRRYIGTELEVISCWLHKTHSIDSRPCGSRQIAWLIAMCWKNMPALCVHAKMDMQTANSRLFGRGSLAHSKQWISGVRCLSWTWHCHCLFSSLADVNGASTSHLPVLGAASVWQYLLWTCIESGLEKQVYKICDKCLHETSKAFFEQLLSKCQEQGT